MSAVPHVMDAGSGPNVFLLHPLGADTRYWHEVRSRLTGRRILAYDLPGHGGRDAALRPFSIGDLGDELVGLMDMRGIDRASLVGVSIGGLIAQDAAARYPDRVDALVLVDTVATYPADFAANLESRAATVLTEGLQPIIDPTLAMWFSAGVAAGDSPMVELVRSMVGSTDPQGYAHACHALVAADLRSQAGRIRAATTVICGSDDVPAFTDGAAWLHEHIAGSSLYWLDGGRHGAALECSDAFVTLLEEVLPR